MAKPRLFSKFRELSLPFKLLGASTLGLVVANIGACESPFTSCVDTRTCPRPPTEDAGAAGLADGSSGASGGGGSAEGGTADGGAAGAEDKPCDLSKPPGEEACLVSNEYAVFVAPSGKDSAPGTQAAPLKTIAKALELAHAASKKVIACNGTYDEQLKLSTSTNLFGGFTCPSDPNPWAYDSGKKAIVAPSARGLALSVATGAAAVVIADFEFDAKDGVDPGESSVAAFINASTNVSLIRLKLAAGTGVDGANGVLSPVAFPSQPTLNGNSATGDNGGLSNTVLCAIGGSTKGGVGGNGGPNATGGGQGTPALNGGTPGTLGALCAGPGSGGNGSDAPAQPAASGAAQLGAITPVGWSPTPGTDGSPGTPGQGGGGGTGSSTGGGGGGGGAGGCGGAPGTGGKAGGASIALLVLNSTLGLNELDLVTEDAGKGGNGAAGQDGQSLFGAPGAAADFGCGGGKGGKGGAGGAGGGGAGGISAGIVSRGAAPMPDLKTHISTGLAGTKGVGGLAGSNDGIDGKAQSIFNVP